MFERPNHLHSTGPQMRGKIKIKCTPTSRIYTKKIIPTLRAIKARHLSPRNPNLNQTLPCTLRNHLPSIIPRMTPPIHHSRLITKPPQSSHHIIKGKNPNRQNQKTPHNTDTQLHFPLKSAAIHYPHIHKDHKQTHHMNHKRGVWKVHKRGLKNSRAET